MEKHAVNWNRLLEKQHPQYRAFVEGHKRVFFYGAGDGAKKLMRFFEDSALAFDGFVVSDGQPHEEVMGGKAIRTFSQAGLIAGDGLIVTLAKAKQAEIVQLLHQQGVNDADILCQDLFFLPREYTVDTTKNLKNIGKTGGVFLKRAKAGCNRSGYRDRQKQCRP